MSWYVSVYKENNNSENPWIHMDTVAFDENELEALAFLLKHGCTGVCQSPYRSAWFPTASGIVWLHLSDRPNEWAGVPLEEAE